MTFQKHFDQDYIALAREIDKTEINRNDPESFCLDWDKSNGKLGCRLVELVRIHCVNQPKLSKGTDVPSMLQRIDPEVVAKKCPHFKKFWEPLKQLCG